MTFFLSLLLSASPVKSVAVLDISAKGAVPKGNADVFNEMLQNAIRELGHKVIGKSDIEQMLGLEKMKDSLGCGSTTCLAEIGGALGVDELVSGVIARVGSYWVITVKRVDPKRSEVLKQSVKTLKTASEDALVEAVAPIVDELYGGGKAQVLPTGVTMQDMTNLLVQRRMKQLIVMARGVPASAASDVKEQAQYHLVRAYEALKDDDNAKKEAEKFMKDYPQSNLVSVVRMLVDAMKDRQRERTEGVAASSAELAKMTPAERGNPCSTAFVHRAFKQWQRAREDFEACLRAGDKGNSPSAYMLVTVTMEQGDFRATSKYLKVLETQRPDLYQNVKHIENLLPVED